MNATLAQCAELVVKIKCGEMRSGPRFTRILASGLEVSFDSIICEQRPSKMIEEQDVVKKVLLQKSRRKDHTWRIVATSALMR